MSQRPEAIVEAAQKISRVMLETFKGGLFAFRADGGSNAEMASLAATIASQVAEKAIGFGLILARDESRPALADEAIALISVSLLSRRDDLIAEARRVTGRKDTTA